MLRLNLAPEDTGSIKQKSNKYCDGEENMAKEAVCCKRSINTVKIKFLSAFFVILLVFSFAVPVTAAAAAGTDVDRYRGTDL